MKKLQLTYPVGNGISMISSFNIPSQQTQGLLKAEVNGFDQEIPFTLKKSILSLFHHQKQSVAISDSEIRFPSLPRYQSKYEIVTLENQGHQAISMNIQEPQHPAFSVSNSGFHRLAPFKSMDITITFKPSFFGMHDDILRLQTSMLKHPEIQIPLLGLCRSANSYYKFMNRVRYDRQIIDSAYYFNNMGEDPNAFDLRGIRALSYSWRDAHWITETEKRSIRWVYENFNFSWEARGWLWDHYGWILRF